MFSFYQEIHKYFPGKDSLKIYLSLSLNLYLYNMRILHIGYMFTVGGAETMLVDIINHQINFAEVAICIINEKISYALLDKLDPRVTKILIKRKERSLNPFKFLQLNREINNYNPDVVHSHQDIIVKALPLVSTPKILTVHDVGIQLQCMSRYKMICSISKAVQNDLKTRQSIDSRLVYNGINISSVREKEKISGQQPFFRILQISRLMHEKKGQDILIRAVSRLNRELPSVNIGLDFIGTGPSENFLRQLCTDCNLENNVRFLGEKDRAYIYESIADYHLLVQPSRYEGFGLTVIEGLAAKVPVLSSNNDGPEEILEYGKYGFLFENGNVDDCYAQLKKIYTRYDSFLPMLEKSFEYVKENFDISKTAKMYLDIYKEAANS